MCEIIRVHVDASFDAERMIASGAYFTNFKMPENEGHLQEVFSLGNQNDNNFAELLAFEIALAKLKRNIGNYRNYEYFFYVDNKSLLYVLNEKLYPRPSFFNEEKFIKIKLRIQSQLKNWKYRAFHVSHEKNKAHNLAYNFLKFIDNSGRFIRNYNENNEGEGLIPNEIILELIENSNKKEDSIEDKEIQVNEDIISEKSDIEEAKGKYDEFSKEFIINNINFLKHFFSNLKILEIRNDKILFELNLSQQIFDKNSN